MKAFTFLFIGFLSLAACGNLKNASVSPNNIISITHGITYGHCRGYCTTELTIEPNRATFVQSGRDKTNFPDKTASKQLSTKEWGNLCNNMNADVWQKMDSIIGCPDCSDGGAEYLIIKTKSGSKKVTIEAGSEFPGLETFTKSIREERATFPVE